jgi:RNA-binding protein 5/10
MFYEAQSCFFYDPKSKLYYGNKKGAYFRYDETNDPPFVEVQQMAPTTESESINPANNPLRAGSTATKATQDAKPTIAIKLKTKKVTRKPKIGITDPKSAPIVSKAQKEQAANIDKWSGKQAELKAETEATATAMASPPTKPTTAGETTPSPTSAANQKIKTTSKGEPICVICKRKFSTVEKLRLHEKASDLHKENLAKLVAKGNNMEKRKEAPQPVYQDRAKKRRDLHGPESAIPNSALAKAVHGSTEREASNPLEKLGADNIGHQLLQKLGWESGGSLGRKGGDSTGASGSTGEANRTTEENLRKDWDRIEALAGAGARKSGP